MKNFAYTKARDVQTAVRLASQYANAKFLGGGTNLVDLMRENIEQPDTLVDVSALGLDEIVELPEGGISLGATARDTAVANHPLVRERYPLLSQTILFGASGQIRNMATVGGNLIAEHALDDLAHAVIVCSTIAKGRIARIDTAAAEASPGTIAVMTHENAPRMKKPPLLNVNLIQRGAAASDLPPLQDDRVHWDGQPVAVVVAATLEQAEYAASLVHVAYETEAATPSFDAAKPEAFVPPDIIGEEPEVKVGDAGKALAAAEFKVDNIYRTPRHQAAALEMHATIAAWHDDSLTVFDSTQWVNGFKHVIARMFDLDGDKVRVRAPFVGGGFGSKFSVWTNTALCVAAAKVANRPVKLMLSREHVFRLVGGRTLSEQRLALSADRDGRFTALVHTGTPRPPPMPTFRSSSRFPRAISTQRRTS